MSYEIQHAAQQAIAKLDARQGTPGTLDGRDASPGAMRYSDLCRTNPAYDAETWAELRALHDGGPRLLRDGKLLERVFPAHMHENPTVYDARRKRAHYFPYAGMICGWLAAGLAVDPVRVVQRGADRDTAALPAWWSRWLADITPPAGEVQSLAEFGLEVVREALQVQCAWVLVDTPAVPEVLPEGYSRADQERDGLLDPYLCLIPAEQIIDWECDEDGNLVWALLHTQTRPRASLRDSRDTVLATWTEFRRDGWIRWQVAYLTKKPPSAKDYIPQVAAGTYSYDAVPLVRLHLPPALWAMGLLESAAREHFNKRSALSWAEYKSLFRVLYEFLSAANSTGIPEMTADGMPAEAMDPQRWANQVRGQGYTQVRGDRDRAEYVGPDVAPFSEARESCQEIMREMFRCLGAMALSANMDAAALTRSGESKSQDMRSLEVVLGALGKHLRRFVARVIDMVQRIRGEAIALEVQGASEFKSEDLAAVLKAAVESLNGLPQRSPAFTREALYRAYKAVLRLLGNDAADERTLAEIRKELAQAVTAEALEMGDSTPPAPDDDQDEPAEDDDNE